MGASATAEVPGRDARRRTRRTDGPVAAGPHPPPSPPAVTLAARVGDKLRF